MQIQNRRIKLLTAVLVLGAIAAWWVSGFQWQTTDAMAHTSNRALILAQQVQDPSNRKQPPAAKKPPTANGSKQKPTPKTTKETKPIKEFVPSEQIDADKAVDFPADI